MECIYFFTTGESAEVVMNDLQNYAKDIRFSLLLRLDDCYFYIAKYDLKHTEQLINLQRHREMYFRDKREKALKAFRLFHAERHGSGGEN